MALFNFLRFFRSFPSTTTTPTTTSATTIPNTIETTLPTSVGATIETTPETTTKTNVVTIGTTIGTTTIGCTIGTTAGTTIGTIFETTIGTTVGTAQGTTQGTTTTLETSMETTPTTTTATTTPATTTAATTTATMTTTAMTTSSTTATMTTTEPAPACDALSSTPIIPGARSVYTIMNIQGTGLFSPLLGDYGITVEGVEGVVTAVDSFLFYIQDVMGDGNDETSDAIVVFEGGAMPTVAVGDLVSIDGSVSEFFPAGASTRNMPTTQLSPSSITVLSSGVALPEPVVIADGTMSSRAVPNKSMLEGANFWESLEGMRVTVKDFVAIGGTTRNGELFGVAANSTAASPMLNTRSSLLIRPDDFNPERIQIDADSDIFNFDFPSVAAGSRIPSVTGVVGYAFGNYEIYPTEPFTVEENILTEDSTTLTKDESTLLYATYNLLNLDTNDSDGDSDMADGRFALIAGHIVNNLNAPDVIALQEIQDNSGSVDDGVVSANATLQALVDAIAVIEGVSNYEFIDNTFITDGQGGGQPGGNIRVAYLYNKNRISASPDPPTGQCFEQLSSGQVLISEVQPKGSFGGSQQIEFIGVPGETLTNLVLVSVDGDSRDLGVVDSIDTFSLTFDANGLATASIGDLEDPSFTLILASSFSGSFRDDLDTTDGGTLDISEFGTILDVVEVVDDINDANYANTLPGGTVFFLGSPGDIGSSFEPQLIFRDSVTCEWYGVLNSNVATPNNIPVSAGGFNMAANSPTFGNPNPFRVTTLASAFDGSRLPLAANFTFIPTGDTVRMINVHLSSKGDGSAAIVGIAQPFESLQENFEINGSLDERVRQSQALRVYIESILAGGQPYVIVLGDFNELEFISPLTNLEGIPMKNLGGDIDPSDRYSFIFQGNSQALDHILVSSDLCSTSKADYVHLNTGLPEGGVRASDHDPVVGSLMFGSA